MRSLDSKYVCLLKRRRYGTRKRSLDSMRMIDYGILKQFPSTTDQCAYNILYIGKELKSVTYENKLIMDGI